MIALMNVMMMMMMMMIFDETMLMLLAVANYPHLSTPTSGHVRHATPISALSMSDMQEGGE